jgi:hypothetical protein
VIIRSCLPIADEDTDARRLWGRASCYALIAMSELLTCGEGMAERATLPATVAALMRALAEVLAVHQRALDGRDENATKELTAYVHVEEALREAVTQLESAATQLRACRDLPPASHDVSIVGGAAAAGAFRSFVDVEQETLELLRTTLDQDHNLLQMTASGRR